MNILSALLFALQAVGPKDDSPKVYPTSTLHLQQDMLTVFVNYWGEFPLNLVWILIVAEDDSPLTFI